MGNYSLGLLGLDGLRGSPWALKCLYCHPIITQTYPRGNKKVSEKVERWKNSIAFGKYTTQGIYPKQHTPKLG